MEVVARRVLWNIDLNGVVWLYIYIKMAEEQQRAVINTRFMIYDDWPR